MSLMRIEVKVKKEMYFGSTTDLDLMGFKHPEVSRRAYILRNNIEGNQYVKCVRHTQVKSKTILTYSKFLSPTKTSPLFQNAKAIILFLDSY